jgi:hypothetical protein
MTLILFAIRLALNNVVLIVLYPSCHTDLYPKSLTTTRIATKIRKKFLTVCPKSSSQFYIFLFEENVNSIRTLLSRREMERERERNKFS